MFKHFFVTLVVLHFAGQICADQEVSAEDVEVMVERYVLGMGKIAKKLLSDSGMAQSDVDRISTDLSAKIRECALDAIGEESAGPVDVELSNDKMESCVHTAFENAGIRFP
jgi:hypothetical protein